MYVASCTAQECAMQILVACLLAGPHGIQIKQNKFTIVLTKNLLLALLWQLNFALFK